MSKTERALDELDTETRDVDASANGVAHDADTADDAEADSVDGEALDASDELVIVENGHDPSDELVDLLVDTPPDLDDADDADDSSVQDDAVVDDTAIEDTVTDVVDTEVADDAEVADDTDTEQVEAREGD
ncbi:MAG: hypothetical protein AAFY28_14615, partial [Actinomycetota bacterium]